MPSGRNEQDGQDVTPPTDESLLEKYLAGDDDAFAQLVRRYERELFGYLARYLGSPNLADDVFQRTFVQVSQKADRFEAGKRFRPWLYSIATNQAIDALRRQKRQTLVSLDQAGEADDGESRSLAELIPSPGLTAVELMERDEQREAVQRTVAALPDHLRQVIILAYFQGWKYQDVADHLQIPVGTVKSRLNAALRKLQQLWSELNNPP